MVSVDPAGADMVATCVPAAVLSGTHTVEGALQPLPYGGIAANETGDPGGPEAKMLLPLPSHASVSLAGQAVIIASAIRMRRIIRVPSSLYR